MHFMIERAIRLKEPLDHFCALARHGVPAAYILSQADWGVLESVDKILQPLKSITKAFEGRDPVFAEVIATMQKLLTDFETHENTTFRMPTEIGAPEPAMVTSSGRPARTTRRPAHLDDSVVDFPGQNRPPQADEAPALVLDPLPDASQAFLRVNICLAILKIKKYRDLMEQSPAYWSAMILHPGYNRKWLANNLSSQRYATAITAFKRLYDEEYSHREIATPTGQEFNRTNPQHRRQLLIGGVGHFDLVNTNIDELDAYFDEPVRPVDDILIWWKEREVRYPRLSQMAVDLLTIPAMSSECERVFSSGKLIIGHQRYSMTDESIEMLLFLKRSIQKPEKRAV